MSLNCQIKTLVFVVAFLTIGAPTISHAQQVESKEQEPVLDFPIEDNSIDAKSFYESVLSKAHWTTDLTQKVSTEFNQTSSILDLEGTGRIPIGALAILTSIFPTAFEMVPSSNNQLHAGPTTFRVNKSELVAKWSDQKLSLRKWISKRAQTPLYEIHGKQGFDGESEKKQLVVVMSGLHGGGDSACIFAAAIHEQTKIPSCAFRYPNDAPLDESSEYLLRTLKGLRADAPNCSITLVAHSMGGLVVRDTLERHLATSQDTLGISRAILICPPNHGSIFAEYAGVLEVAEQLSAILRRNSRTRVLSSVLDGFNEAPRDLVPGSEFLRRLEACKRNSRVKYSVLAGEAGLIDPLFTIVGNELLELVSSESQANRPLMERARTLLNSKELQAGSGDGVVALSSAKLEDVGDFEILPINHLEWAEFSKPSGQRVLNEIVERLTSRSF